MNNVNIKQVLHVSQRLCYVLQIQRKFTSLLSMSLYIYLVIKEDRSLGVILQYPLPSFSDIGILIHHFQA